MNKYKALIRHEWKSLKWLFVYFSLVFMGLAYITNREMTYIYKEFLREGTSKWMLTNSFTEFLNRTYPLWMSLIILGIALMVYIQFREVKNIGVGYFLKALPMSDKKVYLIKVGCGMVTYTIPFILALLVLLYVRSKYLVWMEDAMWMNTAGSILEMLEGPQYLFYSFALYYSIIALTYLFLVMMQYLITHPLVSLIISVISAGVPLYLFHFINEVYMNYLAVSEYMQENVLKGFRSIKAYLCPWLHGVVQRSGSIATNPFLSGQEDIYFQYIEHIEVKFITTFILGLICFGVGYQLSHLLRVENVGQFIPLKGVRTAFQLGVALCLGVTVVSSCMYIAPYEEPIGPISLHLVMLVSGLIGYGMSRKLTSIGIKSR